MSPRFIFFPSLVGGGAVPILETWKQITTNTDTTSGTIDKPVGTALNDILVLFVSIDNGDPDGDPTCTDFETLAGTKNTNNSLEHYVLWKRAGASEGSDYTVNYADAQTHIITMVRVSGCVTTGNPFDVVGVQQTESYSKDNTPNDITSSEDNTLALAFVTVDEHYTVNSGDTVSGTGWSLVMDAVSSGIGGDKGVGFLLAQKDLDTAGSSSPSPYFSQWGANNGSTGQIINLKSN